MLRKVVVNSFGGTAVPANWNLTVTPTGTVPAGLLAQTVTGSSVGTTIQVRPGQTYALSESAGPSGYQLQSTECTIVPGNPRVTNITIPVGDSGICTFTNHDVQPTLTLVKTVTNDNGGTAVPTAWTLDRDWADDDHGCHGNDGRDERAGQRRHVRAVRDRTVRLHRRGLVL